MIGAEAEERAKRILELRRQEKTYREIMAAEDVSLGTVVNIVKGKTWKHLQR